MSVYVPSLDLTNRCRRVISSYGCQIYDDFTDLNSQIAKLRGEMKNYSVTINYARIRVTNLLNDFSENIDFCEEIVQSEIVMGQNMIKFVRNG